MRWFYQLLVTQAMSLAALSGSVAPLDRAKGEEHEAKNWALPMKKVHARFAGKRGTLAQFGDSITVTMAYWAPLRWAHKNMSPELTRAYERENGYMIPDCWDKWKGPDYGNEGGMTIRWAHANIDRWLRRHNPETVVLMFGTNDLRQLGRKEYEQKAREAIARCLKNGTVVIVTTIPPRSGMLEKSRQFADVARKIARDDKLPLVDYFEEILKRRPQDWDGSLAKFKKLPGDEYEVPTLIARDGVHPSNPREYQNYSKESLRNNGYQLRNALTLLTYAEVIQEVLKPSK